MIKKITPLTFLLSTLFCAETTLNKAIAACKNNPEIISCVIGTITGGLAGVTELGQFSDEKYQSDKEYQKDMDHRTFNLSLILSLFVATASVMIEDKLCGDSSSAPVLAIPVFYLSWFATHYLLKN
jgi:hypothetical protein